MRALLLGASGAVGTVIRRELEAAAHSVTAASRSLDADTRLDLRADLAPLARLAAQHDVVINASGIERAEIAMATAQTPLVDISASGRYLAALGEKACGPVVRGAGLVPGLSTILIAALGSAPDDDIDVFVMLGTGERHGAAAVSWTAGLLGTTLYEPPEQVPVPNLRESRYEQGPDGRRRRYLRADFPDHILHAGETSAPVRSYLTLSSAVMTTSLRLISRMPSARGVLGMAPKWGDESWHLVVRNRQSGERLDASGVGQSEATARLTALAAVRAVARTEPRALSMADIVSLEDALAVLT